MSQDVRDAPTRWGSMLRAIGPGIVVTGSVVGSGELINTPQRAATYGFALLWAVAVSCVIKYWLQVELGRYCMVRNVTTVQALASLPGPRWRGVHLIALLYMLGFVLTMAVLAGIVTATAGLMKSVCEDVFPAASWLADVRVWSVILYLVTLALLYSGRYRTLDRSITLMVAGFSLSVVLCVALVQWTPYRIGVEDIASGLTFRVPEGAGYAVISLLGALGTGANELFTYPYWVLENGYGRFVGAREAEPPSRRWYERASGWIRVLKLDVACATTIATAVTLGYYLVAAAVLHGRSVGGLDVVKDVSRMFTETYGRWSYLVFMAGAFCTLYSTLVVNAAATGRMGADLVASLGGFDWNDEPARHRAIRIFSFGSLTLWLIVALFVTQPQNYIAFGQFAVGLVCTPLLLVAIPLLAFRTEPRLRMRRSEAVLLFASSVVFMAVLVRTAPETLSRLGEVLRGLV